MDAVAEVGAAGEEPGVRKSPPGPRLRVRWLLAKLRCVLPRSGAVLEYAALPMHTVCAARAWRQLHSFAALLEAVVH